MKNRGDIATLYLSKYHQVQGKVIALLAGGFVVLDQLDHNGNNYMGVPL